MAYKLEIIRRDSFTNPYLRKIFMLRNINVLHWEPDNRTVAIGLTLIVSGMPVTSLPFPAVYSLCSVASHHSYS